MFLNWKKEKEILKITFNEKKSKIYFIEEDINDIKLKVKMKYNNKQKNE